MREFVEDAQLIVGGDADAGVSDAEAYQAVVSAGLRVHAHFTVLREFECVGNEVAQDLRHLAFVSDEEQRLRRLIEHQLQRISGQQRPQHAAQRTE